MEQITKDELQKGLETLQAQHKEAIAEVQKAVLEKSESSLKAANERLEEVIADKDELTRRIGELEKSRNADRESQTVSFNDAIAQALKENAGAIKGFRRGEKCTFELKAVGDMSPSNFSGTSYSNITTEFRQGVLPLPTERIWMSDVLPGGTTNSGTIWYPRHTGGEGGAAPWTYGSGEAGATVAKPQVDFDFDAVSTPVQWIAGYAKVPRQMLDDVAWLESFLRQHMLLSLKKAENNQIINGSGVSPQLTGINTIATSYDGSYTVAVERIVDAAYGQVNEAFGSANLAILHPRDAVAIALNKATGSGEYDLPPGTIGYVNGQLTIAGLTVVQTTEIDKGNFIVGDRNASQFVSRLTPELRMFESNEDDAKKNLVMFRIEERAALAHYYPTWWVKGKLAEEEEEEEE